MDKRIGLGDRVKDVITGKIGIVCAVTDWLYGCRRITVQPEKSKGGEQPEAFTVDEPQLQIVKKSVIEAKVSYAEPTHQSNHGGRPDISRAAIPSRG
jgi:hypothetical protein